MQKFGGRLRLAATGGAAIPFPVAKTFISLGLTLIQGYGLTETSPVVSFNPIDHNDPNSIGCPIAGIEVKIGDNEELLIKSPGVMMAIGIITRRLHRLLMPIHGFIVVIRLVLMKKQVIYSLPAASKIFLLCLMVKKYLPQTLKIPSTWILYLTVPYC